MASDDLQSRLTDLPGVLSCTVKDDTVALLLRPEVDPRLLKARAQAVCAEVGETRPLIVVGGRSAAGAGAASGVGAGGGGWRNAVPALLARRATPVSIALLSLFVLSAVVLAPSDPDRPAPFSRPPRSPSVALVPSPGAVPPLAGPGAPFVVATPRAPSSALSVPPFPPGVSSVAAEPVLVGPPASGFAFAPGAAASQAAVAPTLIPGTVGVVTPLASSAAAPTAAAGPGTSTGPTPATSPAAAPVQETSRTSSPQLAASSSVEKTTKRSQQGRRGSPRKAAPAEPQGASDKHGTTGGQEPAVGTNGPGGNAERARPSRNTDRAEGPGAAATPEKPERAQKAERSQHGEGKAKPEQQSGPGKGEEHGGGRSSGRGK